MHVQASDTQKRPLNNTFFHVFHLISIFSCLLFHTHRHCVKWAWNWKMQRLAFWYFAAVSNFFYPFSSALIHTQTHLSPTYACIALKWTLSFIYQRRRVLDTDAVINRYSVCYYLQMRRRLEKQKSGSVQFWGNYEVIHVAMQKGTNGRDQPLKWPVLPS